MAVGFVSYEDGRINRSRHSKSLHSVNSVLHSFFVHSVSNSVFERSSQKMGNVASKMETLSFRMDTIARQLVAVKKKVNQSKCKRDGGVEGKDDE